MTSATCGFDWPDRRSGCDADGSPIEVSGRMHALVYFGKGDYRVVADRPIFGTAHDLIGRVNVVHRCGTDVKIYQSGRRDQAEESLLEELAALVGSAAHGDSGRFLDYVRLLETGTPRADVHDDGLYAEVAKAAADLDDVARRDLRRQLELHWGRIFGHETVVQLVFVGSRVHELTTGIGYLAGEQLTWEQFDFRIGRRYCLQSRIAHYQPAPPRLRGARGVQLLGGNITDLAMNQAGAFAQYVRIRPEVIRSGSVLPVPEGIDDTSAALVEPLACLLDCLQKSTHELGQDARGSVLKKGVMPGGVTLVIGSGSMAMMAAKLALVEDPVLDVGGARQVVVVVRSAAKRNLVDRVLADPRATCLVAEDDAALARLAAGFTPAEADPYGRPFKGFDDVILAAGSGDTLATAHALIAPTGGRVLAFAGTRGPCRIESGVWHYGNAAVMGTSGCNTKMMELAIGLLARGRVDVRPLSGRGYTFADLDREGTAAFFEDQLLRPKLLPNEGVPDLPLDSTSPRRTT
jgi:threonine dehydrogenase-like Zn-dependent dehydrogenase